MTLKQIALAFAILGSLGSFARSDSFGSGANAFNIDFVAIGNPGNAADMTGKPNPTGSVAYSYRIGKYEISESLIYKANGLGSLGITLSSRGADKPATSVTWNEAARFVNWLNVNTGSVPAYKFAAEPRQGGYAVNDNIQLWSPGDAGYDPNNVYRNSLARYFLPSAAEWYKAAYYDPNNNVYYNYPTGSDAIPTAVASGTSPGTAVYGQTFAAGPADVSLTGGLSPYGTMGQGGNVFEYEETDYDLVNDSPTAWRGGRGGEWDYTDFAMLATQRSDGPPNLGGNSTGFRVAAITQPPTPGDYNKNGTVDAADYVVWRKTFGKTGPGLAADGNFNFQIDAGDFTVFRNHFGEVFGSGLGTGASVAVPEPTSCLMLALGLVMTGSRRRGRSLLASCASGFAS